MLPYCLSQDLLRQTIIQALGLGFQRSSVLSAATLALLCFFYVYSAASYLGVRVYPLVDRVTYYSTFGAYVTNEYMDHIIIGLLTILWVVFSLRRPALQLVIIGVLSTLFIVAATSLYEPTLEGISLASLPAIVVLLALNKYFKKFLKHQSDLTLNHLAIIGLITGLIALVNACIPLISPHQLDDLPMRNYAYEIFLVLSSFSPALILLLVCCIPVKLLFNSISETLVQKFQTKHTTKSIVQAQTFHHRTNAISLALILLLAVGIVTIPHLPSVNSDTQQIGVDTPAYVKWVQELKESESMQSFSHLIFIEQSQGDRPLSLAFLFILHMVSGAEPFLTIEYSPLVLAPSLVIVMYFFSRQLISNDLVSLITAFLTAISFHTLVGMYAGFYANWIALIFGYLSFLFFFRFITKGGSWNVFLFGSLMTAVLFSHVYTWTIFTLVAGIFLGVILVMPKYAGGRRRPFVLIMTLLSTIAIDVARMTLVGAAGGIESDLSLASVFLGPEQFLLRWNNLAYAITTYVGGLFANFIIYGLGLYWLYRSNVRQLHSLFIMTFLSIGLLPFLIGEFTVQSRIFYEIPFQLPAAIALASIAQNRLSYLRTLPFFIWMIAFSIIAASNFYLVRPV